MPGGTELGLKACKRRTGRCRTSPLSSIGANIRWHCSSEQGRYAVVSTPYTGLVMMPGWSTTYTVPALLFSSRDETGWHPSWQCWYLVCLCSRTSQEYRGSVRHQAHSQEKNAGQAFWPSHQDFDGYCVVLTVDVYEGLVPTTCKVLSIPGH